MARSPGGCRPRLCGFVGHSLLTQSDAHEIPPALFSIRQEGQDTFPHAGVTVKVSPSRCYELELLVIPETAAAPFQDFEDS